MLPGNHPTQREANLEMQICCLSVRCLVGLWGSLLVIVGDRWIACHSTQDNSATNTFSSMKADNETKRSFKITGNKPSTSCNVVFTPIFCLSNSMLLKISNILNGHIELSIYNIIGIFVQIFHSIFKMNEWTAVSLAA